MAYREDSYYIDRILINGDNSAFEGLINKHKTMAYNIAIKITRNREDAEEVAQDSFIKVFHSLKLFKGESKFTTWLFRIVYNTSLSKIRRKSLFTHSIDDENFVENESEHAFEHVDRMKIKDQQHYVKIAMNTLDELDQLVITLYYLEEQSVQDICTITDLSESNVKVRLFRARKKLHKVLSENLKDEVHSIL
jgi:RNA polymerase sigma factor (sigma-70 family)